MIDAGYTSYQDPRLQPPEEPEPTPADCYEECPHSGACRRQLTRNGLWSEDEEDALFWVDRMAELLGCKDCDE